MTERKNVLVIGAGHNGLVCAAYLARAGYGVTILEAAKTAGGMAAARKLGDDYRLPGLAHAACPLSAGIVNELELERFGYAPGAPLQTVALDADGNHLTLAPDAVSGTGLSDADRKAYAPFLAQYREFAASLAPLFERAPPRLKHMDFADKAALAKLGWKLRVGLGREAMYEFLRVAAINIYDVLNERFDDERLKGAIAADAVIGHGMGPRTPGTVFTWLQRLYGEANGPLSACSGGETSLVDALIASARNAGVDFRCETRVQGIAMDDNGVTGVRTAAGTVVDADIVVSAIDPRRTFLELIGAPRLDTMFASRAAQIRGSGTVAKLHLALSDTPRFTGLDESALVNRLLVASSMPDIERAFNPSKYGECSKRFLLEITLPSVHEPGLAPSGHHVMSINVAFVPYAIADGWAKRKTDVQEAVIDQLAEYAPNLPSLIVDREFLTPEDIERDYGAVQGHWHHGELSIHQSLMLRPLHGAAQYRTPVDGLYIGSAGCHPGGGLNGLPGRNAAKRILEQAR